MHPHPDLLFEQSVEQSVRCRVLSVPCPTFFYHRARVPPEERAQPDVVGPRHPAVLLARAGRLPDGVQQAGCLPLSHHFNLRVVAILLMKLHACSILQILHVRSRRTPGRELRPRLPVWGGL
jgi:hypothetical protein